MHGDITDVPGIAVGHAEDRQALTGCTVVLAAEGAVAGCDVRGSAPGTRETDLLEPGRWVERVDAVLLTGGSAFGLAAAAGVVRYLEEQGRGFPAGSVRVPIVPAAVLYDLGVGRADVRPDAAMGYAACLAARSGPVRQGRVGAGIGATVGKLLGMAGAMFGGVGSASVRTRSGVTVGALAVVNALGNVYDAESGELLAGAVDPTSGQPVDVREWLLAGELREGLPAQNTTLGVVATDARLDKAGAKRLAQCAHDGLARSIVPSHTLLDGDVVFALSLGDRPAEPVALGGLAAWVLARAVARAVSHPQRVLPQAG